MVAGSIPAQSISLNIGVKKLIVEMDTKFIKGMINNPTLHPNDAINRWISAILLFDFELVHIPANKHIGADGLSRCPHASGDPVLEDSDELDDWIDTNAGFLIELSTLWSPLDLAPPLSSFSDLRGPSALSLSLGTRGSGPGRYTAGLGNPWVHHKISQRKYP